MFEKSFPRKITQFIPELVGIIVLGLTFTAFWLGRYAAERKRREKLCESRAFSVSKIWRQK